jgi:glycine/D-amino acid oxidase-like deaminating enzyme
VIEADVVIVGGAVIGAAVAYHLAVHPGFDGSVVVVERDRSYARAASALSAGSIRQQFSSPVNIRISLHGVAFLRRAAEILAIEGERPEIGLREGGYLYLAATAQGAATLAELNALQRAEGAEIAFLDPEALAARFPWLSTGDLAAGSLGLSGEGWFDGFGLMQAFARKARSLGVRFVEGEAAVVERRGRRIAAIGLADGRRIACGALVNAAGASGARGLAALMGRPIPVYAKKRCVFPFACREPIARSPLVIDTSGVWWRPEGEGFIAGWSPADDAETDEGADFAVDWAVFEDVIWPALAARAPAFEAIRPGAAWAGHYDMCLHDHNALVGRLGDLENGYVAAGFSGHGLQQAPAVGRGIAELIVEGRYATLDLSDLSEDRVARGVTMRERNVI